MIKTKELPPEALEIDAEINRLYKRKEEIYRNLSNEIAERAPIAYIKKDTVFRRVYTHTIGSKYADVGGSEEFYKGDQIRIIDSWKNNKKNIRTNYVCYFADEVERYPTLFYFVDKDGEEKYISFDKPK